MATCSSIQLQNSSGRRKQATGLSSLNGIHKQHQNGYISVGGNYQQQQRRGGQMTSSSVQQQRQYGQRAGTWRNEYEIVSQQQNGGTDSALSNRDRMNENLDLGIRENQTICGRIC